MDRATALKRLDNGHTIWSVAAAEEIAAALGVSCPRSITQVFESDRHPLGVTMYHGPERGVWSLTLAAHVAECLGVKDKAQGYLGRGSQAREYARVVAEALQAKGG